MFVIHACSEVLVVSMVIASVSRNMNYNVYDLEVMGSDTGQGELGVHHTSKSCFNQNFKNIPGHYTSHAIINKQYNEV